MVTHRIADVVPLRRLPPALDVFTYRIPQHLNSVVRKGQLVTVPFKKTIIYGVVVSTAREDTTSRTLKDIAGVTPRILSRQQLTLAMHLSQLYYQSRAVIFNSFIAPPPRRRLPVLRHQLPGVIPTQPLYRIKHVIANGYILYSRYTDILSYCAEVIRQKSQEGQVLILVPEQMHRELVIGMLQHISLRSSTVLIPPKQQLHAHDAAWQHSQTSTIIVGSLTSTLMPFTALSQIIVFEAEHHQFHAAEQNPRYHLADFIFKLTSVYQCNVLLTGFSPDISLLHLVRKQKLPVQALGKRRPSLTFVAMKDRPSVRQSSRLSLTVVEAIRRSPGKVILVCNRYGDARIVACRDCGFRALCEQCQKPLTFSSMDRKLICGQCGFERDVLLTCPQCGGVQLAFKGFGTTHVVKEIQRELPGRTVMELTSRTHAAAMKIASVDIVVATNKIFSHGDFRFEIGVMVNPDVDLHLPNMHAAESLRHYIQKLRGIANHVYIQTFNLDHYVYQTIDDIASFYRKELAWRQKFHYPPVAHVVKVMVRDRSRTSYLQKLQHLRHLFSPLSPIGPYEAIQKGTFTASVLVKCTTPTDKKRLDALLTRPYNWFHVEVNPYDIT